MRELKELFREDEHRFFVGEGQVFAGFLFFLMWSMFLIIAILGNGPPTWIILAIVSIMLLPFAVSCIVIGCFVIRFDGPNMTVIMPILKRSKTVDLRDFGYAYYMSNIRAQETVLISNKSAKTKKEIKKIRSKARSICFVFGWLPKDGDEDIMFNIAGLSSRERQEDLRKILEAYLEVTWNRYDWGI